MHRLRYGILLGIMILLLSSCGKKEESLSFFSMDTYMSLRAYGCQGALLQELKQEVEQLEATLSVTRPGSEIYRLNEAGLLQNPAPALRELAEKAWQLGQETEGALDVTLYPLIKEWGFPSKEYRIPAPERIRQLRELVDYRRIQLSPEAIHLAEGMALDLGSVAKGYTGDRLAARLREAGVKHALLDLGGNIQTIGGKPDGKPWQIGIRNPEGQDYLGVVSVRDMVVITSGGYERHFIGEDGKDYWHILDPATGYPAESGFKSVTVIGPEGWRCDGLSTALFVMGPEKARAYWLQHRDFDLVLLTEEGRVIITEGLRDSFQLSAGNTAPLEVWTLP
ncbi:MAG: FAD:protein FMN transferase [Lachnospiraceae bacterium]|nr:FAD:protein FMN transferase [Lachnospiraceae bacterium]